MELAVTPRESRWMPTVDSLILRASRMATSQQGALAERRGPPDYNVSPKKCFALIGSDDRNCFWNVAI